MNNQTRANSFLSKYFDLTEKDILHIVLCRNIEGNCKYLQIKNIYSFLQRTFSCSLMTTLIIFIPMPWMYVTQ